MEVKILGIGCPKCKWLEEVARAAAAEAGIQANFSKVTDWAAITAYPIMATPGLVIDEELVSQGRIPQKDEIIAWMKKAQK